MERWIVIFRSHAEGPADEHFVDVEAPHALAAVREALRECPPLCPWVLGHALPWPAECEDIDAAVPLFASA